jgi:hypothetical protein
LEDGRNVVCCVRLSRMHGTCRSSVACGVGDVLAAGEC